MGLCDRILYEALRTERREIDPAMLNRVLATESLAPSCATNTIYPGQAAGFGTKSASSAEAARELTASKDEVCPQAPASVPESNLSEPDFLISRICSWFSSQPGEWSGTAAELGIASGICNQPLPELLQAVADEFRKFGIAARIERRPGRPRTVRLSRLYTDVRASCTE